MRNDAAKRGIAWDVVNRWNWHRGSFEGIRIDPATAEMWASGDPRRSA